MLLYPYCSVHTTTYRIYTLFLQQTTVKIEKARVRFLLWLKSRSTCAANIMERFSRSKFSRPNRSLALTGTGIMLVLLSAALILLMPAHQTQAATSRPSL